MADVLSQAQKYIAPIIEDMGYEVVDIEYKKLYNQMNLTFYIYKQGGITIEDCERVNNALDAPLEQYDITQGQPYILNISSPGLDRPIKTDKDLSRNMNTEIEVALHQPQNKKKKLSGELIGFDETTIRILSKGKETIINRNNIKKILPYIKF